MKAFVKSALWYRTDEMLSAYKWIVDDLKAEIIDGEAIIDIKDLEHLREILMFIDNRIDFGGQFYLSRSGEDVIFLYDDYVE